MSHFRLLLMNFCKKNREKSYNVERTVLKVLHKVKVKLLSHVRLFATPWTVACTRILHPWDFLLLQGIFLTQGSNLGLPHCRQTLYLLNHQRSHKSLTQKVVVKTSKLIAGLAQDRVPFTLTLPSTPFSFRQKPSTLSGSPWLKEGENHQICLSLGLGC